MIVAAFNPDLSDVKEAFLSECRIEDVPQYAKDPALAERLWQLSESLTSESAKL